MSARRSDMAKELVLALIGKMRRGGSVKRMLPDVKLAYGEIHRMLREAEDQEFAELRKVMPAFSEPRIRAKNLLVADGKGGKKFRVSYKGRLAVDRGR